MHKFQLTTLAVFIGGFLIAVNASDPVIDTVINYPTGKVIRRISPQPVDSTPVPVRTIQADRDAIELRDGTKGIGTVVSISDSGVVFTNKGSLNTAFIPLLQIVELSIDSSVIRPEKITYPTLMIEIPKVTFISAGSAILGSEKDQSGDNQITADEKTDTADAPGARFYEYCEKGLNIEIEDIPFNLDPLIIQTTSARTLDNPHTNGRGLQAAGWVSLGLGSVFFIYGMMWSEVFPGDLRPRTSGVTIGSTLLCSAIFSEIVGYAMSARYARWAKRHGKE